MADMCCCLSGKPLDQSELKGRQGARYAAFVDNRNQFDITMCEALCREPCCCLLSGTPFCFVCAQVKVRYDALDHIDPGSGWSNYTCCQGYYGGCCCIQPGQMGEQICPPCCMTLEAALCPGMAVSATRFLVMDRYSLAPDEGDNRIIRCNNCLQIVTCVAVLVNCIFDCGEEADECVQCLDCISDIVFLTVSGCMTAQVHHELKRRNEMKAPGVFRMMR